MRRFFQEEPDAVILSDHLPADELNWLSSRITTMSNVPLIGLGDHVPHDLVTRRLDRSAMWNELPDALKKLLESNGDH